MMRFVVLALAVLLAGCQARFLQDEPPSHLVHMKSTLQVYSDHVKQSAHRILAQLDDTEFENKEFLGQSVDNIHNYLQHSFQAILPICAQVLEATAPMREKLTEHVEDFRKQIEPMREELKDVLKPFIEEYLAKLMEEEKTKLEPVVKSLKEKIGHNWEETKSKLIPILEAVRNMVTAQLQELKTQLELYIQRFRDQIEKGALELRKSLRSGELRKTLYELGEEVKPHFQAIYEATRKTISKE
ncbi:apolipo A-I [Labeo rohita]|nr:apolipo A-I [Labeo rohita]